MLTFVIPTHDRPSELRIAVKSILDQITDDSVSVLVLDNGSSKETQAVLDDFDGNPHFSSRRFDDNQDYSVAFHRMMTAAPLSDWVWTFGDDDKLMPGALSFMVDYLAKAPTDLAFIHVAEVTRAGKTSNAVRGALIDLCCNLGWIDVTGFITGNICRGSRLSKASATPRWKEYSKSAFVHSCAILEEFKDDQAVFLDLPLIATQSLNQTDETVKRWIDAHIPERYLYVSTALERMFDDGILTKKLPAKFFRYLNYHLWDRFISHFISDYTTGNQMWIEDSWANVARLARYIDDPDVAEGLVKDIEAARGMITLHFYMQRNIDGIRGEIDSISLRRGEARYPYSYVETAE